MKKPLTKEVKKNSLLRLPASRAHVWAYCGGSAALRDAENPLSTFDDSARRGVVAHKIGANKLREVFGGEKEKLDAVEFQLYEKDKEEIDRMADFYLGVVRNEVEKLKAEKPQVFIENRLRVETEKYLIEGPPDCYILTAKGTVVVFDLKTGWVEVEAENNIQLLLYGHSIALNHKLPSPFLRGIIVQPPLRQVSYSIIVYDPDFFSRLYIDTARFSVGSHCAGCGVKTACKVFNDKVKKYLAPEYADATIARLKEWPELLDMAKAGERFFKDIQSQAFAYLSAGGKIPGWGLRASSGRRTWQQGVTAQILADRFGIKKEAFEKRSLETPAEVEKILKSAKIKPDGLPSFYYQPQVRSLAKTEHEKIFLTAPQGGSEKKIKRKGKK